MSFLLIIMEEIKYVYHFRDFTEDNLDGFCIYTAEEVNNFIKKEPGVFFEQHGPASKMNDLAFAMYNAMRIDIIANYQMMYQSHHHT